MIDIDNRTDLALPYALMDTLLAQLQVDDVELLVCSDELIRDLNHEHRGIDCATDVLSFPYDPMPMTPAGSIVISANHVKAGAQQYGHSEAEEFALLFLHALLHLKGYDHETDQGEMRRKEAEVIGALDLPNSLIIRTEDHV